MKLFLFMMNFFFFNDPATTEIYALSLHDALPISHQARLPAAVQPVTLGLGPAALLEAARRLERLERGTQPRLQVAEVPGGGGGQIASAAHARSPPGAPPRRGRCRARCRARG